MSNKERKEARYQRRKQKRLEHKQKFLKEAPKYSEVFTFENLYNSFQLCRKEVGQKPSLQIFQQNLTTELVKLLDELYSETGFISRGFIEFNICERGKMRHIKSVDIRERVVQRCFCDYYLVPLLSRSLIYDNGASLKRKGVAFSLDRVKFHLEKYYKKYRTNKGYILLYDFSNYFGNIDHFILYKYVDSLILDDKCKKLYHYLVDAFGDVGLGLGSQVSQISAVAFPNIIDHKIANFNGCESSARYMDDGYAIFHSKEKAEECMQLLLNETAKLNIQINPKKIKICRIDKIFIFIKKRFFLNNKGQAVMKLNRNNIYKHRRRVTKLMGLVDQGVITVKDVELCHKSQYGQVKNRYKNKRSIYDIHKQIRRLLENGYANSDGDQCRESESK